MTSDPGMLNISYETLADAQGDLAAAYTGAQATIDDLKAKLAQSLSSWSGDARNAYDEVQREWAQAFAHMAAVLQKAQVHLGSAHDMYQDVERQNASIWTNG